MELLNLIHTDRDPDGAHEFAWAYAKKRLSSTDKRAFVLFESSVELMRGDSDGFELGKLRKNIESAKSAINSFGLLYKEGRLVYFSQSQ